jgi:hypothetical protein
MAAERVRARKCGEPSGRNASAYSKRVRRGRRAGVDANRRETAAHEGKRNRRERGVSPLPNLQNTGTVLYPLACSLIQHQTLVCYAQLLPASMCTFTREERRTMRQHAPIFLAAEQTATEDGRRQTAGEFAHVHRSPIESIRPLQFCPIIVRCVFVCSVCCAGMPCAVQRTRQKGG